jgi:hypothetical protein
MKEFARGGKGHLKIHILALFVLNLNSVVSEVSFFLIRYLQIELA